MSPRESHPHVVDVERRVVHILFADLVEFTALSERLDPEHVAFLQERFFRRVREAVESRGGRVEKFVGDAVMAVFGLPVAQDGNAAAAVEAGLCVVGVVQDLAADLAEPGSLQVRVGINSGEVVVGWTAHRESLRVTGDPVNTAARLQAAAAPAEVLVGADTGLAAERMFALVPRGKLTLKGKTEGVATWRVDR